MEKIMAMNLPFKFMIFLWKIYTNCLPCQQELHKRVSNITPLCQFSHKDEKDLEHLFFCLLARVVWFGIDLTLRTNELKITTLKEWIGDWLSKSEFHQPEGLWFYCQFICTIWCIWMHRSEVIFKNQSLNSKKVIFHQKSICHWIAHANRGNHRNMSAIIRDVNETLIL